MRSKSWSKWITSFVKIFISSFIQSKQHISKSSSLNLLIYHMHYAMSPWSLYRYPSNNALTTALVEHNNIWRKLEVQTVISIHIHHNSSVGELKFDIQRTYRKFSFLPSMKGPTQSCTEIPSPVSGKACKPAAANRKFFKLYQKVSQKKGEEGGDIWNLKFVS